MFYLELYPSDGNLALRPTTAAYDNGMSEIDPRIQEQKRRWSTNKYVGQIMVVFTVAIQDRQPLFQDLEVVQEFTQTLADCCDENSCEIPIYCFMPDHLHLIVRGRLEYSNTKAVVDRFIFRAGFWLRTEGFRERFQSDYHDQIISGEEDWRHHAQLIALNPVRAGLAEDLFDYPHTGCIGMDRTEMLQEIFFG